MRNFSQRIEVLLSAWVIGYEERGVENCQCQSPKKQEQIEAQPDGAGGAAEQTGTNGIFREPFRFQSCRDYGQ